MIYSLAPMEGITAYPYRNAHAEVFPGTDRYYTPFITANQTRSYKTKEKKDAAPENNRGLALVPQILTKEADQFVWAVGGMAELGYREVNLNLGCPSPTVTSHGKGSAFLKDTERLDAFFEEVFRLLEAEGLSDMGISVKTRIGFEELSEAEELIRIYNRYPFAEVIVHPRLGRELYRGTPHREVFRLFYEECRPPLAYNGDIRTAEDAAALIRDFPKLSHICIGRGLLTDPALVRELRGGERLSKEELKLFHDRVLANWLEDIGDFRNIIGKMKELWFYWERNFEDCARELKQIKKARTREAYEAAAASFFEKCELRRQR